jgi:MSHA pilin protein MshD
MLTHSRVTKDKRVSAEHRQAGLTLVEMVVTIVILSVALLGIAATLNLGVSQSSSTLFELRATALAQAYLDEILSKKYDERSRNSGIPPCVATGLPGRKCTPALGLDGSESARTSFDDVDDYNGLDEGLNGSDILRDTTGAARSGYDTFRVQVSVRRIQIAGGQPEEFTPVDVNPEPDDVFDAKLITVTVSGGSATGIQFSAYKSNF